MGKHPVHAKQHEREEPRLARPLDRHVEVAARELLPVGLHEARGIRGRDEEAGGVGDGEQARDGDRRARVGDDGAQGGGEAVGVEGIQSRFVHVQDVVAVELIQVLDPEPILG